MPKVVGYPTKRNTGGSNTKRPRPTGKSKKKRPGGKGPGGFPRR